MTTALRITGLNKTLASGRRALQDIELRVAAGEMVALTGRT